ncbi:hypothetical protein [Winogradskyella sp.]|uniref:hypothetical protein n=1 Tax=Winogradskyella sp. TaxID=1883156 RepID=UPI0026108C72|nr:hypothetical protein [Winogradskyella sp.]
MKQLFAFLVLLYSIASFAQDHNELEILEADSTWTKEFIKFPLSFAPDIDYEGYEDIRFAQNWKKPSSSEFFTYAFVWNINLEEVPTVEMLNEYMALYYDGLMTLVNKDKDVIVPHSKIQFEKENNNAELSIFKGQMDVYDAFFTQEVISLYAKVEAYYCKNQHKYVLLFRIATKSFDDAVWEKLKKVKLVANFCK